MKKMINRIWVIAILLIMGLMFAVTLGRNRGRLLDASEENSVLEKIDNVYTDFILGKYSLAYIDSKLSYYGRSMRNVNATRTLVGKDGWLFLKDNLDGYLGREEQDESDILETAEKYIKLGETCKAQGMDFILLIAPNKMSIYGEFLPDYYEKSDEETIAQKVVMQMKENSDIPVLYPIDEMSRMRDEYQLYYKCDTHWNEIGAFVGTQLVIEELGQEGTKLTASIIQEIPYEPHDTGLDDLANMIDMYTYFHDETDYKVTTNFDMDYMANDSEGLFSNEAAREDKKVLLVGDSFRCAMMPALLSQYSEVYQIQSEYYDESLLETIKPDIVIYEVVEREL